MLRVRDLMTRKVVAVRPDTPLKAVARLLVKHDVSGLPVVEDGEVVGVVSEADVLIKELGPDARSRSPLTRLLGAAGADRKLQAKVEATTAGEAMTSPAITIAPEQPVNEAAAMMATRRVNRLPVVSDGLLVGLISRADIVRAYVLSDEELAELVRNAILYQTLWVDPASLRVSVTDGHVRIEGSVERRSTAGLIERIPPLIPGVVGVTADLTWEVDDQALPGA